MSSSENGGACKKLKTSHDLIESEISVHEDIKDLSKFNIEKVLYNNSNRKSVCLQGSFEGQTGVGIVLLEKTAFDETKLKKDEFFSADSSLKKLFHNDIYGNYECFPKPELNALKTTIIHPATEKHIIKYSVHNTYIVDETFEIYKDIVLPHIAEEQFDLEWLYNILEHKSEVDRIAYEDTDDTNGFILLPDLKWDGKTLETLHFLAIIRDRSVKSLRDLTGQHLKVLRNIQEYGEKTIKEKHNLDPSQLRVYLHYQPSFYHLHVHFTYLQYDAPGIFTERAHLLSNVISNIELLPDYYQKATLPFTIRENDTLFKKFEAKNLLKRSVLDGSKDN